MIKPRVVYIAHAISGDVPGNSAKVRAILKKMTFLSHPKRVYIAPYLNTLEFLDDYDMDERTIGMEINATYFQFHFIDELRLCGEVLSDGMKQEIDLADAHGILTIGDTEEMDTLLHQYRYQRDPKPGW